MTVITTGTHPKALWPGVKAYWGKSYDKHSTQYNDLFDFTSSKKAWEELVESTGFGLAPIKSEGSATQFDTENQATINRATHVAIALGYAVTHEEIKDNLYEAVSNTRVDALSFSMAQTKENFFANFYNRAFNGSFTFGDGVSLINTAHPTSNGTQSNRLAINADISESAIEDLTIQIKNARNTKGLNISIKPKSLHTSTADFYEACRIYKSNLQSNTAENNMNVIRYLGLFPGGIKENQYFTDTDAWFIRTTAPTGMTAFQRESISFDMDNDFPTKNALSQAYERYSATFGDFRGLYGSAGA